MADDLYAQFGVSPKDYFIDPETNTIKRKELPLPVETLQPLINDFQVSEGSKIGNKLFGTGGEERFQTWPERMVRSGSTIFGDVYSGAVPIESPTGYPGSVLPVEQPMEPNAFGKALGIGNFSVPTAGSEIGRAQDAAGLAGMSSIPLAPKGALGAIGGKFYSTLENTIAGSKVQKATPEQWTSYLKNQPGIKPEELEFSLQGLGDKPLTKEQLAQHVADNGIKFNEVWKGGKPYNAAEPVFSLDEGFTANSAGTKYSQYQLPGGENYRELLMTTPTSMNEYNVFIKSLRDKYGEGGLANKPLTEGERLRLDHLQEKAGDEGVKPYQSSHWDEPNVLAHIRMNDREIPGIGKTLHVEEIQSDWHQAGRKSGYREENEKAFKAAVEERNRLKKLDLVKPENRAAYDIAEQKVHKFAVNDPGVPNAPFKKTWDELALKRVLSEAATKGYDAVSWTPGEAQAARYDLSKQINNVLYIKDKPTDKNGTLLAYGKNGGNTVINKEVHDNDLVNIIGKEASEKLINMDHKPVKGSNRHQQELLNADLKVGGEGMKAFYDTMLPAKANALIKKMGGKVEYSTDVVMPKLSNKIGEKPEETRIPIIKLTPQMRETIANKGFPLYSSGVPTFTPVDGNPHEKKYKLVPVQGNPFQ